MTLRVAAYCRVSTDKTDQLNSFESQKAFFSEYIDRRPGWTLAGIFTDEGITGTSTARRSGFLSMISDAMAGKLDLIITKEVSRFSRNILDTVAFTRKLKAAGVGVIFLNDGISTLDPDSELRLGIMASVAQEESRKTSQRVKWGQQRSMEKGVVFGPGLLGYDVNNGQIVIEPRGAEVVRSIFAMYVYENKGARAIAAALTRRGIPTKTNQNIWSAATVLKIIKNEKYCGDLIQRKTITENYLTHQKTANRDPATLICIKDHHEPIVERSLWEAAQAERNRRTPSAPSLTGHGSRYPLSGKIYCAHCGAVFTCRTRKRKDGSTYRTWCGGCYDCFGKRTHLREELIADSVKNIIATISETGKFNGFSNLISRLIPGRKALADTLQQEISYLERKKLKLIDTYLSDDIEKEEYLLLRDRYETQLLHLHGKLSAPDDLSGRASEICRTAELLMSGKLDPDFFFKLVYRIDVARPDKIAVYLNNACGSWTVSFTL